MPSNPSGINPKGWRILIKPKEIPRFSKGGIQLGTNETSEREQMANTTGIVIAMGDQCYEKMTNSWCKEGDKVIFAKYAGLLYVGRDGLAYRLVNDDDITGTLEDDVDLVDPHLSRGV